MSIGMKLNKMKKLKSSIKLLNPNDRLYQLPIPVIGLTGGIASGKSSVASLLQQKGFSLLSADNLVKKIYQRPESLEFVKLNFSSANYKNQ